MSKHTPAPWTLQMPDFDAAHEAWCDKEDGVEGAEEEYALHSHADLHSSPHWHRFASVAVCVGGSPCKEGIANALLIKAAPDLLESLDPDTLESIADEITQGGDVFTHSARAASLRSIAKKQREAIAKTEGTPS